MGAFHDFSFVQIVPNGEKRQIWSCRFDALQIFLLVVLPTLLCKL